MPGAREIRKYDAGRRHRRPRVQKQVRNVGSNVPTTFYSDWEAPARISRKSPKKDLFLAEIVLFATPASESNSSPDSSNIALHVEPETLDNLAAHWNTWRNSAIATAE